MDKMKAGVVHAKNDIRYEDIEKPEPKKGEVRIHVQYTGICGSDVPRVNGDACHFFPNVLGHEFSGVVDKVGEGVTNLKPGDRVAGVPLVPCMECEDCLQGNYSLCKHYSFIGSRQYGSFAEYVVVPERNAVKFDDEVSFEQGAFFEPATVALHGLQRVNYQGGKTVAVLGEHHLHFRGQHILRPLPGSLGNEGLQRQQIALIAVAQQLIRRIIQLKVVLFCSCGNPFR